MFQQIEIKSPTNADILEVALRRAKELATNYRREHHSFDSI